MARFWKYLPKSVYQTWRGNKFAKKAQGVIDAVVDLPEGGAELAGQGLGAGQDFLGDAWRQFGRGQDWWRQNVQQQGAGLTELGGGIDTTMDVLKTVRNPTGIAAGALANRGELAGDVRRVGQAWGRLLENPSWKGLGDVSRKSSASGVEKFAQEQIGDPLTYVGGYSKALKGVPLLEKAAPAIGAIERLPGTAEQRVAKGITRAGAGVLSKLPGDILAPSVTGAARQSSNEIFDLVRRGALDPSRLSPDEANRVLRAMGKAARYGSDGYGRHADTFQEDILMHLDPALGHKPPELWGPEKALQQATFGVREGTAAERSQKAITLAEDTRSSAFTAAVAEARKAIGAKRAAAKKAGGKGAVKARVQEGIDTLYTGFKVGPGFEVSPAGINRMMSVQALNTPAYPIGSGVEDVARSLFGGGNARMMGKAEFAKEMRDVPMPVPELFTGGGQTAAMLDIKPASTAANRAIRGASNLLTGRTATSIADTLTGYPRRGFVAERVEQYQKAGLNTAEAAAKAIEDFKREFPNYLDETKADAAMKALIPFWGYQKTKYPYLARKGAEMPGAAKVAANYYNETDEGHIPFNPDWQINPLKGSVLNIVAGANKPFYPTYARGPSGAVERGQDMLARAGFYPGAATEAALATGRFLQGEPVEPGSFIPGPVSVPLEAVQALGANTNIPGVEQVAQAAGNLQDTFFDDRFRQYYIAKELAAMGVKPDEATPEQRAEAEQRTALRMATLTEGGVFRWRPEAERNYREEQIQAAIGAGVPEQQARSQSRTGNPLSAKDAEGRKIITDAASREIYLNNPQWEPWRQATEPLKREDQRQSLGETRGYFDRLDEIDQMQIDGIRDSNGRLVQVGLEQLYAAYEAGALSGKQLREQRSNLLRTINAMRDEAKREYAGRGALVDEAARQAFYGQTGRTLRDTTKDEAARSYYDVEVQVDPTTGQPDFDTFFAQREAALAAMPAEARDYVLNQYPRDRYKDRPGVAAGESMLKEEMGAFQDYLKLPRYYGVSKADEEEIQAAAELIDFLQGEYPYLPADALRAMVATRYPKGAWLGKYATKLRRPERDRFLQGRPRLRRLLSDALGSDLDNLLAEGS